MALTQMEPMKVLIMQIMYAWQAIILDQFIFYISTDRETHLQLLCDILGEIGIKVGLNKGDKQGY